MKSVSGSTESRFVTGTPSPPAI
ncbi:MAG: hypothetical protein QOG94_2302, partial [Solirubrobacteraceae bacterium]|nr:hypothetical protein [Solirubrobacteraceae bacterium]